MTDLWLTLFVKATVVIACAGLAAIALRNASAAARHLVWVSALLALLVLTTGPLLPDPAVTVPVVASAIGSVTPETRGIGIPLLRRLWIGGCVLLLLRMAASGAGILLLLRRSTPEAGAVRIATGTPTPLACGFGRDLVVLPAGFRAWSDERRRAVLLHEYAHLERRDCWSLLLGEVARALYWPNPLVWYAVRRLRREQEHAADDSVLRAGVDAADYAAHLIAIARSERAPLLLAGAATCSELGSRVEAILDPKRRRSMLTKRMVLACAAALVVMALPLAALQSGRKTYKVGEDGVTQPVPIYKVDPAYTPEAKAAKIEGAVLLNVTIESDGNVYDVSVIRGLDRGLDANAIAAVSAWRFKPAEKNGKPVAVRAKVDINFRLR